MLGLSDYMSKEKEEMYSKIERKSEIDMSVFLF